MSRLKTCKKCGRSGFPQLMDGDICPNCASEKTYYTNPLLNEDNTIDEFIVGALDKKMKLSAQTLGEEVKKWIK